MSINYKELSGPSSLNILLSDARSTQQSEPEVLRDFP